MDKKYPHVYKLLKQAGHSPATAVEILFEAVRGDTYALDWVKALFRIRRS